MDNRELLESTIKEFEPAAGNDTLEKFSMFQAELKEWNEKFNLTSLTDDKEIIIKHFADSLSILKTDAVSQCETLLDLGSGAGFPGIPVAIIAKDKRIFLVESNNKKISFLEHIKEKLALTNVFIIAARSETMAREKKYREKFDMAMARALAKFPIALELSIGLIRNEGYIAYYASQKQKPELIQSGKTLEKLKCEIELIYDYSLQDGLGEHAIVIVKKLWKTDSAYPREFNKIKRNPL
jgi:16S rRNA (guanine527-N7)-methyltransferase